MVRLLIFLSTLLSLSCYLIVDDVRVAVVNKAEQTISNVCIYTSEKVDTLWFQHIKQNESGTGFIDMEKNQGDGHYILEFTNGKGKRERVNGGYFTNGGAQNSSIEFEIRSDTTIFKASSY